MRSVESSDVRMARDAIGVPRRVNAALVSASVCALLSFFDPMNVAVDQVKRLNANTRSAWMYRSLSGPGGSIDGCAMLRRIPNWTTPRRERANRFVWSLSSKISYPENHVCHTGIWLNRVGVVIDCQMSQPCARIATSLFAVIHA